METVKVGQAARYTSTEGRQQPAQILATRDSIAEDDTSPLPRPAEGFVHIVVVGLTGMFARMEIPLRETAEQIPDFTIEGQLVGFVEVV